MTLRWSAALIGAAALLAPMTVQAEQAVDPNHWRRVASSTTGTIWLMRERDAQNQSDRAPKVWVKLDHSGDRTVSHRETKQFIEFDCDGRRTKTLETLRYNATGGLVGQETPSYPQYSYVPPDTVIEATLMWACPTNN
jgi:hypothetical protein